MKNNIYSTPTVAKDGVKYRSKFEAEFVNKFLYNKGISYEYEKRYPDSLKKCDFYLTDLKIWIELVYHGVEVKYAYEQYGKKTYLSKAGYNNKNYIKKAGGQWDPVRKMWYIVYTGNSIRSLEQFMEKDALVSVLYSNGKTAFEDYDERLREKISKQHSLIVVTHEDMKRSSIQKLLIAKNSISCFSSIICRYFENLQAPVAQ